MSEGDKKESGEVTRREFLKDAGFIVGGAAIGAGIAWPLIPATETEKIVEVPGPTTTVTVDLLKYVCPSDGQEFDSISLLTAHMESAHPGEVEVITKYTCPYDSQEFASLAALTSHVNTAHPPEVVTEAVPGLITLTVNGKDVMVEVEPEWTLAEVIRDKLLLPGTKMGCNRGECGTCTVIVDGRPVYACTMLVVEAEGKDIQTIEGLATGGTLHPVQQAFKDNDTHQCGYCTPGFIMAAKALLDENPNPTLDDVREALSGHICSCGDTKRIVETVLSI